MTLIPEPIPHTYSPSARLNIRFKHFVADALCGVDKAMAEDKLLDVVGYISHMMRFEQSQRVYLTTGSYDYAQFGELLRLKHQMAQVTPITLEYPVVFWGEDAYGSDVIELHIFATTDDETYQEWLEA